MNAVCDPLASKAREFVVLKFGGTSVSKRERWNRIATTAIEHIQQGRHPVIVCSGLAGITDRLVRLAATDAPTAASGETLDEIEAKHHALAEKLGVDANEILGASFAALRGLIEAPSAGSPTAAGPRGSASWKARVLASGELMSTRLGAAWLRTVGLRATWADARSVLQSVSDTGTETDYLSARCGYAPNPDVQERFDQPDSDLTITQGFVASNEDGDTVVLGRGGSDTSAAYFAAILAAEELEIWTDVPGLFTMDPRYATDARLLPTVSYDEAAVLGSLGAKVLHPRCLTPVRDHQIPLTIRWTDRPEVAGTRVLECETTSTGVKGLASRSNLCVVRMQRDRTWQPVGFMAAVSACFDAHDISMDLISSSPSEIRASIDLSAVPHASAALPALTEALAQHCKVSVRSGLACVSIAGSGVSGELPRIAAALHHLGEPEIHMVSHSADDTHVSYVVDEDVARELVSEIHETLFTEAPSSAPSWAELQALPTPAQAPALA